MFENHHGAMMGESLYMRLFIFEQIGCGLELAREAMLLGSEERGIGEFNFETRIGSCSHGRREEVRDDSVRVVPLIAGDQVGVIKKCGELVVYKVKGCFNLGSSKSNIAVVDDKIGNLPPNGSKQRRGKKERG